MANKKGKREDTFGSFETYNFEGLKILADSMAYVGKDRVFPIIAGEQSLICRYLTLTGRENIIDAGTGSGVLALYAASHGCKVLGIDILPRAIKAAVENSKLNKLQVKWKCEPYLISSATESSADLIVFNPPHHLTAPGIHVAQHAFGGEDGLSICTQFIQVSLHHIINGGKIIFFQLTPSRRGKPKIFEIIDNIYTKGFRLRYLKVLPTASTKWFLENVYLTGYSHWIDNVATIYPEIDLVLVELTEGGPTDIQEITNNIKVGISWAERVALHRSIFLSARTNIDI